jgi:hypothetical protein
MQNHVQCFLDRWLSADGSELANSQLFLIELCELLELPKPEPANQNTDGNAYVFERRVDISYPDGSTTTGRIDLYKRGCFVLEAKKPRHPIAADSWDKTLRRAYQQADNYIRALPAEEGRPPFLIVLDVGRSISIYAEFSCSGATYVPFPDPHHYRIQLIELQQASIRARLQHIWLEPLSLDPSRIAATVTRAIAKQLAQLAKSLETAHTAEAVTQFLMRCLFTMFAEDIGLLPHDSFTDLLESMRETPEQSAPMLEGLWHVMNEGGFSPQLRQPLLRFNGGLFKAAAALPLHKEQLALLITAARADWTHVEPAIFGTLLERALDPQERHKLGAHYTPRAYVERLVLPTVLEPLRKQWRDMQAVAVIQQQQGQLKEAIHTIRDFHRQLCQLRILDPACGSGNFLYVTLEHLKRLEGEILNVLTDLGDRQGLLELEGVSITPKQFLGLELNPRAAALAEMVLWIGYLQWHFRTYGNVRLPDPVLRDFGNIVCRDAVLAYDEVKPALNQAGQPLTRWDGRTKKRHPITGKLIPDERAQVPVLHYHNPRCAEWPQADYIIGNPPFIGAAQMRAALGDGYVAALRTVWHDLPESTDFVMYWWHQAAELVRAGQARAFGLITTNSLKQTFNRRVVQAQLEAKKPLSLVLAIPDHPWVDSADGAAVRIAMTAGRAGDVEGTLHRVIEESRRDDAESDEWVVKLKTRFGKLHADLTMGAHVGAAVDLRANTNLCSRGVQLIGAGFMVTPEEAEHLLATNPSGANQVIRNYRNGRDLTQRPRGVKVIDLFGLRIDQVQQGYPTLYQWLLDRVKPERDQNNRASYRHHWWLFGEQRKEWRCMSAHIERYIATVETSKHRFFTFLDQDILPDNMLVNIALEDALALGILSSRIHVVWVHANGGTLGPARRYNKTVCFETFPFPETNDSQQTTIRDLGERLDQHRKQRQAEHPDLTLTALYNVLEHVRLAAPLSAQEKIVYEQGLVAMLKDDHDALDRAVFAAYGWDDLAAQLVGLPGATTPLANKSDAQAIAEEELLARLVALNAQRANEEAQGTIRWLRPEFQAPEQSTAPIAQQVDWLPTPEAVATTASKHSWPKSLQGQIQAVRQRLASAPQSAETIAVQFKRKPLKGVQQVLAALQALGMAEQDAAGRYHI